MSINLPEREVLSSIFDILESLNIRLPQDDVEVVTVVFCHWLKNTQRGHEYMAHVLRLKSEVGDNGKVYEVALAPNLTEEMEPEKIVFLKGCVANGKVVPLSDLIVSTRENECCETCGAHISCVGRNENGSCSYCWGHTEDFNGQYQASISCDKCNDTSCTWHPANQDLPPLNYKESSYEY